LKKSGKAMTARITSSAGPRMAARKILILVLSLRRFLATD
jgi:hypothetical protein